MFFAILKLLRGVIDGPIMAALLTRRIYFQRLGTIVWTSDTLLSKETFKIEEVRSLHLILQDLQPDGKVGSCMGRMGYVKKETHQLTPMVSHSSVRRVRVSSDRELWNEDIEKGIALSVPDPEFERSEEAREPSDLGRLEAELEDGAENMSINVLCRLSVVVVFVSIFVFVSAAVALEDALETTS